jgi:hypothetical protein
VAEQVGQAKCSTLNLKEKIDDKIPFSLDNVCRWRLCGDLPSAGFAGKTTDASIRPTHNYSNRTNGIARESTGSINYMHLVSLSVWRMAECNKNVPARHVLRSVLQLIIRLNVCSRRLKQRGGYK